MDLPLFVFNFVLRLIWTCFVWLLFSDFVMFAANITANINYIPMLNESNFKSWQDNLLIVLVVMDLNLALRVDFPPPLTDESAIDDKNDMERWEGSNHMCITIMKKTIP